MKEHLSGCEYRIEWRALIVDVISTIQLCIRICLSTWWSKKRWRRNTMSLRITWTISSVHKIAMAKSHAHLNTLHSQKKSRCYKPNAFGGWMIPWPCSPLKVTWMLDLLVDRNVQLYRQMRKGYSSYILPPVGGRAGDAFSKYRSSTTWLDS